MLKKVQVCIDGKEQHLEMQEIDKGGRDTYLRQSRDRDRIHTYIHTYIQQYKLAVILYY